MFDYTITKSHWQTMCKTDKISNFFSRKIGYTLCGWKMDNACLHASYALNTSSRNRRQFSGIRFWYQILEYMSWALGITYDWSTTDNTTNHAFFLWPYYYFNDDRNHNTVLARAARLFTTALMLRASNRSTGWNSSSSGTPYCLMPFCTAAMFSISAKFPPFVLIFLT